MKEEINAGIQTFMRDYIELLHADAFPDNLAAGTSICSPSGTFRKSSMVSSFPENVRWHRRFWRRFTLIMILWVPREIRCEVPTI